MQNVTIWPEVFWGLTILIILSACASILHFGGTGKFWKNALTHLDAYGPKGEHHEMAVSMFDLSKELVEPYKSAITFFVSFGGSLTLMSGLLLQGWYVPLGFEIAGSAIGYGFIHYFQVNKFIILGQITGADEAIE